MAWGRPRPSVSSDRARRVEISGYRGRASSRNFRFSSAGVMLALPGGQHRSDAVAAHGPQRPLHVAGGLVFDGKDGDELTVHRQKNAGLELQVTGQGHMVLFHEIGAAHGDRFPTDGTADAAVLVKTQVLQMQVGAALAGQHLVKQRRQLASGGLCRRGGIGYHLADLLAVQLQSVEAHRSRWEQVVIRHHHPPGGGDGGGPGIARHGAAAAVQTPGSAMTGAAFPPPAEPAAVRRTAMPTRSTLAAPAAPPRRSTPPPPEWRQRPAPAVSE